MMQRGQDDVEYLVGPLKIYSYHNTIDTAIKKLPENYSGRDNNGSMRSYESVIMNNIKIRRNIWFRPSSYYE